MSSEQIAALESQLRKLNDQIAEKDMQLATVNERAEKIAALKQETEANRLSIESSRTFLTEAEEQLREFPTDAQLQKMKTNLDTVKINLDKTEGTVSVCQTGLHAYKQRRQQRIDTMMALSEGLMAALDEIERDVTASIETESTLKTKDETLRSLWTMQEIDCHQEDELQRVVKATDAAQEQLNKQARDIADIEAAAQQLMPAVEAARDEQLHEILDAWTRERDDLKAVYLRYLTLNKEQHYHLLRGTHVKQAAAQYAQCQVDVLTSQNAHLYTATVEHTAALKEIKETIDTIKRSLEIQRAEGRAQEEAFAEARAARETRLIEAKQDLQVAMAETNELRNVKAELQTALKNMSSSQAAMMRTSLLVSREGRTAKSVK